MSRIPPHNLDAEMSVLGAMLASEKAVITVMPVLTVGHFYKPGHALIFDAIRDLTTRGEPVDAVTVADELQRANNLDRIGGKPYIHGLLEAYPTAGAAGNYAEIIRDHAKLRQMIEVGNELQNMGFAMPEDVDGAVNTASQLVHGLSDPTRSDEAIWLSDNMDALLEDLEERAENQDLAGLRTGIPPLDKNTGGWKPGQLIVIGARPSMGKTGLLTQFACAAAKLRKRTAFFTLEMSPQELRWRILSQESGVNLARFGSSSSPLEGEDFAKIAETAARVEQYVIRIDGRATLDPVQMAVEARRLASQIGGLDLVVVDYLQLVQPPKDRGGNANLEVSDISRALKVMARELHIPVITASQLNRKLELRQDKRPILADLRDSGAVEQDADIVIFLYREEVYTKREDAPGKPGNVGKAEAIIAKHRNGPTGFVPLRFIKEQTMFTDSKYQFGMAI